MTALQPSMNSTKKSVQLEYDKESDPFVLQWYERIGYVVTAFGIGGHLLLVKKL